MAKRSIGAGGSTGRTDQGDEGAARDGMVTALARGLDILRCFTVDRPVLGTSEISRICGLPQPTVWRLCNTLRERGFLVTSADGAKLRLGIASVLVGHAAAQSVAIIEIARPHMQKIADDYRAGIGLAVPDGDEMVLVQRCQGEAPLILNLHVGSRVPMSASTYGWVYLAALPEPGRERLLDSVSRQPAWTAILEKQLPGVLATFENHRYVLNCGGFRDSINSLAVAVCDSSGMPRYTMSLGALSSTLTREILAEEVAPRMIALSNLLRETL